jgi:glycosyltransferase involved in cell wall biosynthesis
MLQTNIPRSPQYGQLGAAVSPTMQTPTISIIIKALNEGQHIASAIESAIAALTGFDGEVILADGGSTDRTVEIAGEYPITIVRLNKAEDRSCGSGAQLGFQYSRGEYLMLIDGDAQLQPGFLPAAIAILRDDPTVAGVGGAVIERGPASEEYEQRRRRYDPDRRVGLVTRLNSSGLYRRAAIRSIGYLTDRNLHGAEELDLGARLHARGWRLVKIDRPIIEHHPHTGSAYRLLLRRVFNKNAFATGELLGAAIGQRHFWFAVGKDHNCLLCLAVTGWWITLALATVALSGWSAALATGAILLFPFAGMSLRWRSVRLGLYSVTAWNVFALCFWPGLLQRRLPPADWIESTVLQANAPNLREGRATAETAQTADTASGVPARDAEHVKSPQ